MISTEDAQNAFELVGAKNIDELVAQYGGMTQEEILESLNESFPDEDNENLAGDIYTTCANAEWLKEMHPKYF